MQGCDMAACKQGRDNMTHKAVGLLGELLAAHGGANDKPRPTKTELMAQRRQAVKSAGHRLNRALSDLDSAIDQMAYADGSTARKDWQPTAAQWLLMYQLDAVRYSLSIKALLAVADGKPVDIDMAAAVGKARDKQARRVEAVAAAAARS